MAPTGQQAPPQTPPGQAAPQNPAQTPAQGQTPQQQPPKPVFRTGADLVRVDVAVLDKKGEPVPSLTAADFELQEDGVTQEIRSFQFIRNTGEVSKDDDVSLTIRSRSHAEAEAAKDNVRLFLIFWDEYHIGQMASANRARGYLMQFVRTAFGPTDIVGFMDPLTPSTRSISRAIGSSSRKPSAASSAAPASTCRHGARSKTRTSSRARSSACGPKSRSRP